METQIIMLIIVLGVFGFMFWIAFGSEFLNKRGTVEHTPFRRPRSILIDYGRFGIGEVADIDHEATKFRLKILSGGAFSPKVSWETYRDGDIQIGNVRQGIAGVDAPLWIVKGTTAAQVNELMQSKRELEAEQHRRKIAEGHSKRETDRAISIVERMEKAKKKVESDFGEIGK